MGMLLDVIDVAPFRPLAVVVLIVNNAYTLA